MGKYHKCSRDFIYFIYLKNRNIKTGITQQKIESKT